MTVCPIDDFQLVDAELDRILTQYRESPKLIHLIRTYLRKVEEVMQRGCAIPPAFDLNTATGHQLTLIGKQVGFLRCHCICATQPVFGFECEDHKSPYTIVGFCEPNSTWINCDPGGYADICINDDELYRKFLKVRAYQVDKRVDMAALDESVRIFWGDKAKVLSAANRKIVIAPGRELTPSERNVIQLYPRVLPVTPGTLIRFHFDPQTNVFGFGEGWGGFCDDWLPEETVLATENGSEIVTDDGLMIEVGPVTRDAIWMCQEDVRPYDCA